MVAGFRVQSANRYTTGPDVSAYSMPPCEWKDGPMLRWAIMFDWRRPGHECIAAIAQLGERQTEDLKVPGSILGLGIIL